MQQVQGKLARAIGNNLLHTFKAVTWRRIRALEVEDNGRQCYLVKVSDH